MSPWRDPMPPLSALDLFQHAPRWDGLPADISYRPPVAPTVFGMHLHVTDAAQPGVALLVLPCPKCGALWCHHRERPDAAYALRLGVIVT